MVPGMIGDYYSQDKRVDLLPKAIQDHYKANGEWVNIVGVLLAPRSEVYTVSVGKRRRKDTWRLIEGKWTCS